MARLYRTHMVAADERESVGALSDAAYRVWVALTLRADDAGRVRASAKQVRAWTWGLQEVARRTEEAETALAELDAAGEIVRYEDKGEAFAYLAHWGEDQRIDHPTASRLPSPPEPSRALAPTLESSRKLASPRENSRDLAKTPETSRKLPLDVEGDVEGSRTETPPANAGSPRPPDPDPAPAEVLDVEVVEDEPPAPPTPEPTKRPKAWVSPAEIDAARPECVALETWAGFMAMRRAQRWTVTDFALRDLVRDAQRWASAGHDVEALFREAATKCYRAPVDPAKRAGGGQGSLSLGGRPDTAARWLANNRERIRGGNL